MPQVVKLALKVFLLNARAALLAIFIIRQANLALVCSYDLAILTFKLVLMAVQHVL